MTHWIIVPIVLPLLTGGLLVLLERRRENWVAPISVASAIGFLLVALLLLQRADTGALQAYLLSNWQAPFGIALALDRLSALMLLLLAVVALASLTYALGGDARRGAHFHALFHFQLMGLAGAFLTADLFNLFVFFEVLLAASYGLLLHGQGPGVAQRLKASVHYVVFNLTGSALFLIAVSLLYGLTGTLNMADLAVKIAQLGPENQRLAQAAALMLLVVFAVKAALLPLYFWLPDTYASATAPVAALFAIMSKVGVYAVLRTTTLIFGVQMAQPMLPLLALATLVLAAIGALASTRLRGLVAYLVVGSAGLLLLAVGLGTPGTVAAAVFYIVHSTLVGALLFLLADRIAAARGGGDALQATPLQGGWAPLGVAFFIAAVAAAGMPPLGGFFGKALLLQAAGTTAMAGWVITLVLASSLVLMVSLGRAGSTLFWRAGSAPGAALQRHGTHSAALAALVAGLAAVAVLAGPLSAYAQATAAQLFERQTYIRSVLGAQPVPAAIDVRKEMRERGELK